MKKEEERVVWMVVATVATTTAAVILLRRWQRSSERRWRSTQRILHKFASECATPVTKLWEVSEALVVEMKTGLLTSISSFSNHEDNNDGSSSSSSSSSSKGGGRRRSKLPMLVSHIDGLPTGDEIGIYYGLTLSGTEHLHVSGVEFGGKLQISRVQLGGKTARIVKQESQTVHIPSHWMVPSAKQELFDCIADGVKDFVSKETDSSIVPPAQGPKKLGFTYSFPLKENMALTESSIKLKSFFLHNTKQLVDEFNSTLARHGVDMRVSAMVEDTVGNLSEDKYYNSEVVATITMGMGTNAAYVELESEFSKDKDSLTKSEKVIDIEWGSFSSSHIPLSEFDVCLDIESSNPGEQMFEKLIAGMYLGEIVRRVLLKMAKETALFGETVPSKLRNPYSLRSPDMAAMHQDTSENRVVVDEKLKDIFGITNSTPIVREVVAEVCDIVAERAARLAGAGIVSILKKLGRIGSKERSVVTIEGGLYQHYRVFRNYLHSGVWEMLGHEWSENVVIQNSIGGSGIEAVFLAASHSNSFQDS